jgi:hypothetical protein
MRSIALGIMLVAMAVMAFGQIALAQKPCEGEAIEVLNVDICEAEKWIAVEDSATICQIMCVVENPEDPGKACGINPSWIGGTVEADEEAEYGFNFDPATVEIAEIVAEVLQTTTCAIAEDPKGFSGGRWFVPADLREIR